MPYIYKRSDSPSWWIRWSENGERQAVSSGSPKKSEAQELAAAIIARRARERKQHRELQPEMADILNQAAQLANRGALTVDRCRDYLKQIYHIGAGEDYPSYTVRQWLEAWLAEREPHVGQSTIKRYRQNIRDVLKAMGATVSKKELELLTAEDVRKVQTKLAARKVHGRPVARKTVNLKIADLRRALGTALEQGLVDRNVAKAVKSLPEEDSTVRTVFTPQEVQKLMSVATDEWRGVILLGAHTGLRLSNIVKLKWSEVDLERGCLHLQPVKQQRGAKKEAVFIPMTPSVLTYFKELSKKGAHVFSSLHDRTKATHSTNFRRWMEKAKVPRKVTTDGGIEAMRSFHCLRHSYISWMTNQNVAEDVRMKLAAHKSSKVHAIYSHHDEDQLRDAVDLLPDLLQA